MNGEDAGKDDALKELRHEATAARIRELGYLLPAVLAAFEAGARVQDVEDATDTFGAWIELVEVVHRLWEGSDE